MYRLLIDHGGVAAWVCSCLGCTCPGECTCPRGTFPGGVPGRGVPARGCTYLGGVPSHGGVPAQGEYLPRGVPGGVPAWGVPVQGRCTFPGGCTSPGVYLGGVPAWGVPVLGSPGTPPVSGFPLGLENLEKWEGTFQSGKSQGILNRLEKSGKSQGKPHKILEN